jgi:hypothetical protein
MRNKQVLLAKRPRGEVQESDFRIVETDVPPLQDGEVLTRVLWLSLDPYMRGRMDETKSYAPSQRLGEVMIGGTVGEVVESKNPRFQAGDVVVGSAGWQQFQVSKGSELRKVDVSRVPASYYVGCLGMPGVTAWYGITRIGRPKPGETLTVTAASGAVGSVVGQLAKALGCRAVGIAGGPRKCEHVVRDLGFDACVDYKSDSFAADLTNATPNGIDVVFENVGGKIFDAELARMNTFGRIALCGLISGYGGEDTGIHNTRSLLVNRLLLQGFITADHLDVWPQAIKELAEHVAAKRLRCNETVAEGLENAPKAFMGMLKGANLGKQLVKVA